MAGPGRGGGRQESFGLDSGVYTCSKCGRPLQLEMVVSADVERPMATMFVWAPIPEPYRHMGSLDFASFLVREGKVAVAPGVGFGPTGDGFVRFALIENEQRIAQAVRNLRRSLTRLEP